MDFIKLLIVIWLLWSCNGQKIENWAQPVQLRDSLISEYFRLSDSMNWVDREDPKQLLLSYHKNDTSFLKNILQVKKAKLAAEPDPRTSCFSPQKLDELNLEEGYRFEYHAAFCDQALNLTIGRAGKAPRLIAYLYKFNYATGSCISYKTLEREISEDDWMKIERQLVEADIWGLKESNGIFGLDGSRLVVTAYEKGNDPSRSKYVRLFRWAAERTSLGRAFKTALMISGISVPCFHTNEEN